MSINLTDFPMYEILYEALTLDVLITVAFNFLGHTPLELK